MVIRNLFLSEIGSRKYRKHRGNRGEISDKKVDMGRGSPMSTQTVGEKISDKNILYFSPVNFFNVSSSVTVYRAEFSFE